MHYSDNSLLQQLSYLNYNHVYAVTTQCGFASYNVSVKYAV